MAWWRHMVTHMWVNISSGYGVLPDWASHYLKQWPIIKRFVALSQNQFHICYKIHCHDAIGYFIGAFVNVRDSSQVRGLIWRVTGHNGHKPKRPQPKRPQTETATNRNGHKPERPQTETATNRNGHKPKRPQTGTATNRNGHRPERPQTETATSVVTHHISCHQNKYDGESPIGNDDIHARLHRNQLSPE